MPELSSYALGDLVRDVREPFSLMGVAEGRVPVSVGQFDVAGLRGVGVWVNVLDMPIKLAYGEVLVPNFIPLWVRDVIGQSMAFERDHVTKPDAWYTYLTLHQSVVAAGTTQRNSGAHIDGMQGEAYADALPGCHAYLLSTDSPTVFYPHLFNLTGFDRTRDNLYRILDEQKDPERAWSGAPGELVAASCYCVHEAGMAPMTGPRSFVRVEFSMKRFDRSENTRNPLIDTATWDYRPRPIPAHLR